MAKETKRGNREAKKPKRSVPKTIAAAQSTKGVSGGVARTSNR